MFERAPHGGLRVDLARHPHAAVIALVHGMVRTIMPDGYVVELPMGVKAQPQAPLLSRLFAAAA